MCGTLRLKISSSLIDAFRIMISIWTSRNERARWGITMDMIIDLTRLGQCKHEKRIKSFLVWLSRTRNLPAHRKENFTKLWSSSKKSIISRRQQTFWWKEIFHFSQVYISQQLKSLIRVNRQNLSGILLNFCHVREMSEIFKPKIYRYFMENGKKTFREGIWNLFKHSNSWSTEMTREMNEKFEIVTSCFLLGRNFSRTFLSFHSRDDVECSLLHRHILLSTVKIVQSLGCL